MLFLYYNGAWMVFKIPSANEQGNPWHSIAFPQKRSGPTEEETSCRQKKRIIKTGRGNIHFFRRLPIDPFDAFLKDDT